MFFYKLWQLHSILRLSMSTSCRFYQQVSHMLGSPGAQWVTGAKWVTFRLLSSFSN